ncbi:auxin-responsive protein SAUR32-like [Wolffia australiana]
MGRHLLQQLHGGGGSKKENQHTHANVRKGFLAVMVGQEGEDQRRFVVPVGYLSHPLFVQLLKEAEEVYGFDQKGAIALPCNVEEFRYVQGLIEREFSPATAHGLSRSQSQYSHHNLVACFRA